MATVYYILTVHYFVLYFAPAFAGTIFSNSNSKPHRKSTKSPPCPQCFRLSRTCLPPDPQFEKNLEAFARKPPPPPPYSRSVHNPGPPPVYYQFTQSPRRPQKRSSVLYLTPAPLPPPHPPVYSLFIRGIPRGTRKSVPALFMAQGPGHGRPVEKCGAK